ncbi:cytochrome P450 oxidoreductase OrdA-like protein [Poronia punctata]|nr:cytochrome P450 oxidoreductase OrdA-like protein [Poronia punctata]
MGLAVAFFLLATALATVVVVNRLTAKKKGPLPPGPKGLPLVGNMFDLPSEGQEWMHWLKHKDQYGPISSVTALSNTIVIVHSPEIAFEMFEKKSSIYSSRPRLLFGSEMVGWGRVPAMMPYGSYFRANRKRIHTAVGTHSTVLPYAPLQEKEALRFLLRVMRKPDDLEHHIRTEAGAMILSMVYGYTIEPHKPDPLVELADTALNQFALSSVPGGWLVDTIPALRHLPDWFPGAGFKKIGKEWRKTLDMAATKPFLFARQQMARGVDKKFYLSGFPSEDMAPEEDEILKWTATSLYAGGSDTTVNTLSAFFLAMTLHPEVQARAQEEIDRVVGPGRLPTFDDRDNLPYINAVVQEAWRWHVVLPLGLPHASTADHYINGYFIPKGATVMSNVWWFTHDPEVYPNPDKYDPLRFMTTPPPPDPTEWIFGFGRRICPGRFFAQGSVWLTVAKSLAAFNISKGLDESGREIDPVVEASTGVISRVKPYKATVKPRSPEYAALIEQVESMHPWEKSHAEELASVKV